MDQTETDLRNQAEALMKQRRFAEAIGLFDQHLRDHGRDLRALLKLGICHLLNRTEQAFLDIYQRARRIVAKLRKMPADIARLWAQYGDLVKRVTATALVLGVTATAYSGHRYSAGVSPKPVPTKTAHKYSGGVYPKLETLEMRGIKSLAQLRKLTPVAVLQDWQIRLGVADLPDKARPWLLLYCHAKYAGRAAGNRQLAPPTQMYTGAELLGPVSFVATTTESLAGRNKLNLPVHPAATGGKKDAERLYVAAIPVVPKQATYIFVHSPDAEKIIGKWQRPADAKARAHPWVPFAAVAAKGFIVADEFQAARPTYPRTVPLWRLVKGEDFTLPRPIAGKLVRNFLPGCVRGDAPYYEPRHYGEEADTGAKRKEPFPLKLARSGGAFVVGSRVGLVDRPDEYLLARWWVNDKAVVPPVPKAKAGEQAEKARTESVSRTKEMKVALRLPTYLGTLKAGDEVVLQVMHCDGGYSRVGGAAVAQLVSGWPAFGPMLSNELTFTVTKEMLSKGATRSTKTPAVPSSRYQGGLHLRVREAQPVGTDGGGSK